MATFIFNQYYIDFLKRIKEVAKDNKETSSTAKSVLKNIKNYYTTLDKSSDEYLLFINNKISNDTWEKLLEDDYDWLKEHEELEIFQDIKLEDIKKLLNDDYMCYHFISVFYIFRKDLTEDTSSKVLSILQTIDSKKMIEELEDETIKKVLNNLQKIRNEKIKDKAGIDMNFIESTSLGKLAKEIIEDIDVGKLQKSMGENGDILKAIGDPDSGFSDIITSVSKKMANKISNGELKQENLIQDAMKFASLMPNIFGGAAKDTTKNKGPDMSNIINMMSSMMGGAGGGENDMSNLFKSMGGAMANNKGHKHRGKPVFNDKAFKKIAKAKKLRKKLDERKKMASMEESQDTDE